MRFCWTSGLFGKVMLQFPFFVCVQMVCATSNGTGSGGICFSHFLDKLKKQKQQQKKGNRFLIRTASTYRPFPLSTGGVSSPFGWRKNTTGVPMSTICKPKRRQGNRCVHRNTEVQGIGKNDSGRLIVAHAESVRLLRLFFRGPEAWSPCRGPTWTGQTVPGAR